MSIFSETGQLILAYSGLSGLYSGIMRTIVTLQIQTKMGLLDCTLNLEALNSKVIIYISKVIEALSTAIQSHHYARRSFAWLCKVSNENNQGC